MIQVSVCNGLSGSELEDYVSAYGYRSTDDSGQPLVCELGLQNHHIHDGPNNTFAAIRVINATQDTDLLFAVFADVNNPKAWDFAEDELNYFELYDVTSDYYMQNNIYPKASEEMRKALMARLQAALRCKGRSQCRNALENNGALNANKRFDQEP